MIQLIVGEKGSGKTKILVDAVNQVAETCTGNVVCIEKAMSLQYSLKPSVRLIHADEYAIAGYDQFYGFFCGVLAGNYDIKDVYIDGILRIGNRDVDGLVTLIDKVDKIAGEGVRVVFSLSMNQSALPESLAKYV